MKIAIQPETFGTCESWKIWEKYLKNTGHEVKIVNVLEPTILESLKDCQGFIWKVEYDLPSLQIARSLLPVIENELGITVFPDHNSFWHYDDKVSQAYLFEAAGIPHPKTWIYYDHELSKEWAKETQYPLILKLHSGSGSKNVRLIPSFQEAELWIDRLFTTGVYNLKESSLETETINFSRVKAATKLLLKGAGTTIPQRWWELHKCYVYFQEFIPGNNYDTRILIIGERAFGFRRFNRKDDYRASGSGNSDFNPKSVAPEFIKLGFDIAHKLQMYSCALDFLWKEGKPIVLEVSYITGPRAPHICPGHWDSTLCWREGQMYMEEAFVQDLQERLNQMSENN